MDRKIGSSLAEDDLVVQVHLLEEQAEAYVRLEMRRATVSFERESVIGVDLLPAEARALGRFLLARADGADFRIRYMAWRRKKLRFPLSLLQNGRIMRPVHVLGAAIGLKLFILPPDGRLYWLLLGVLVLIANIIGYTSHPKDEGAPHDEGRHE